jgi:hypothetical protein
MNANDARSSERRRHGAIAEAAMHHLAETEVEQRYYKTCFTILWEYGEHTPFEAACEAWRTGDRESMDRALADDRHLAALAKATR